MTKAKTGSAKVQARAPKKQKKVTAGKKTKQQKSNKPKGLIIKVLAGLLALAVVVGGGFFLFNKTSPKTTEVGLLVDPVLYETIYKQVELFEKENPNIKVTMTVAPKDSTERLDLLTKVLSSHSSSIDVFWGDVVWPSDFISNDWLLPLSDSVSQNELNAYLKGPVEGCKDSKGELYCLPIFPDAGILYYRKDILAKENIAPPQTWNDLVQASQTVAQNNPGMTGIAYQGESYEGLVCNYLEYVWGNNSDIISNGKVTVNTPANVESLQFMTDLVSKHKIAPANVSTFKEEESRTFFMEGKSVFLRNWPYVWGKLKGTELEGKVGIIPMVHNTGGQSAATLGGANVMVNKASTNPDASVKLAKFLSSKEAQKLLAVEDGVAPTISSLYSDPDVLQPNPYFGDLYQVLIHAKPRPIVKNYGELSAIMQKHLHLAVTNKVTPQVALANMQQEIDTFQAQKQ